MKTLLLVLLSLFASEEAFAQQQASVPAASAPMPSASTTSSAEVNPFTFNPLSVKRDPFIPPEVNAKSLGDLERFDLSQILLVAVMTGLGAPKALVSLPDGSSKTIQIGDRIGRQNGVVFKIQANEVIVKETFKDYQGRVRSDLTSLLMAR